MVDRGTNITMVNMEITIIMHNEATTTIIDTGTDMEDMVNTIVIERSHTW